MAFWRKLAVKKITGKGQGQSKKGKKKEKITLWTGK